MKKMIQITQIVGVALVLVLLAGCELPPEAGEVRVRLAADIRDAERLATLEVAIHGVGVQHANRPIDDGWVTWQPARHQVDLTTLEAGETIALGAGTVPARRYDRVRVVIESAQAQATDGVPLPLTLTVEPIAIPFELQSREQVEITIELIALPQANDGYELFTKAATISRR
ncbi:MAG: hypothetical protein MAG451_02330 [Anaerolineales bacterium]|nr:hypothetical protein [Anaerolineales bacterium]